MPNNTIVRCAFRTTVGWCDGGEERAGWEECDACWDGCTMGFCAPKHNRRLHDPPLFLSFGPGIENYGLRMHVLSFERSNFTNLKRTQVDGCFFLFFLFFERSNFTKNSFFPLNKEMKLSIEKSTIITRKVQ